MPEIKNTFLQGKMNKDLDERLIPNGQYRDALNVEVSTSEGSDVGTVKNILGNQRVENLVGSNFKCVGSIADEKNNKLYWFISKYNVDAILEYDADNDIAKYVLVDTYAGTNKAVLKFFGNVITGINVIDNLLFWTDNHGEPKKINIDTCKAGTTSIDTHTRLSFENGSFHGITVRSYMNPAVSDRYFYYPREKFLKAIDTWMYSPSDSANDTVMRSPIRHYRNGEFLGAYDINFFDSTNWPNPDNDPIVLNRYTSDSINYVEDSTYPGIIPHESGGYPGNGTHGRRIWGEGSDEDFREGDVIFGDSVAIDIAERHVTVIKPKPLNAPTVKINHTESSQSTSKIPNLFETKFPRFSYRYKYRDGEYSTFAPFTEPVFNAKYTKDTSKSIDGGVMYNQDTAYDIKEPYNKAMVNAIHSVDLTDFITAQTPEDVVEVDILYKQENSSVIYSIDTIKHVDSEWHDWSANEGTNIGYGKALQNANTYAATGGLTGGKYVVTTENIYAALPANQLLRPWDNVPRKALAQEVTGNRIVYGNYLQNYDIGLKPQVQVSYSDRQNRLGTFTSKGLPSIKSQRNYQLGVVYCDKYGRETPVFTSNDGAVNIPWQDSSGNKNASKSTQLTVGAINNFPEWVDSLKFFVKETSNEYYNLTMDRAWVTKSTYELDNSEGHLWISFPSSDRNKISEEDYIILKKKIGVGEEQVTFENKFKIVDIKNEAPDAIKYELVNLGVKSNDTLDIFTAGSDKLFISSSQRIDKEVNIIVIGYVPWKALGGYRSSLEIGSSPGDAASPEGDIIKKNLYVSWRRIDSNGELSSKKYKVTGGWKGSVGYVLSLSAPITKIDADIASVSGDSSTTATHMHQDLIFQVEEKVLKDSEDFSGKFFVKISKNQVSSIIETGKEVSNLDKYQVTAKQGVWYWHDDIMTTQGSPVVGNPNYGLTNFYGYDPDHDYNTGADGGINHIHKNYTDSNGSNNESADPNYNPPYNKLRISDWWEVWSGILNELDNKPRFFVDAMHMIAGQSEASDYAKYCCMTWSGCTKDDNGDTAENSAWSYPPLKTWLSEFGDTTNLVVPSTTVGGNTIDTPFGGSITLPDTTIPSQSVWYENNLISTSPLLSENADYENLKIDGWVGPLQNVSRDLPVLDTGINNANHVNGLEGLVTTNEFHTTGPRRWFSGLNGTDYGVGDDTRTYSDNGEEDRHFMHLSFFAPGKDLHAGGYSWDFSPGVQSLYGEHSWANNLQGIWGGGVFTGESPSDIFGTGTGHTHLALEGNYDSNNDYLPEPPGPGIGFGYNLDYRELHERQWDPTFLHRADGTYVGDPGNTIRDFIRNLYPGSKFRFNKTNSATSANNITDDAVYTIKKVTIKKLYNHTSWRKPYNRFISGEGYDIETEQHVAYQSVEETALRWLNQLPDAGTGGLNPNNESNNLKNKIVQFGASHNRRLCYIIELDKNPRYATGNQMGNPLNMSNGGHDGMSGDLANSDYTDVEFLDPVQDLLLSDLSKFPAIWEVDPKKQEVDLDIYYEASNNIPVRINERTNELFAPIGCKVEIINATPQQALNDVYLESWDGNTAIFYPGFNKADGNNEIDYAHAAFKFIREDGSYTVAEAGGQQLVGGSVAVTEFKTNFTFKEDVGDVIGAGLAWYNCFSFGNGLESNRIRDDFNEMFIANGVKASTTTQETYEEERRSHGLIYSGIYNSNSGINDLNQFIMAEKITKDLNPTYGSVQKLFQRRISLIAFCEDRVIQITSNKDAIYNADGNPQLISSSNVLGDANPFVGNFGISKNPESFASESYRAYFTDKARGAVLRLSKDGLTPISKAGMHDWFRDNLPIYTSLIGTYDSYKENYNITLSNTYTENIIFNTAFGQGVDSNPIESSLLNIIENGGVFSGNSYVPSFVERDVLVDNTFNGLSSLDTMQSQIKVTNHPQIPQGWYQTATSGIVGSAPAEIVAVAYDVLEGEQAATPFEWADYESNLNLPNSGSGTAGHFYKWVKGNTGQTFGNPGSAATVDTDPNIYSEVRRKRNGSLIVSGSGYITPEPYNDPSYIAYVGWTPPSGEIAQNTDSSGAIIFDRVPTTSPQNTYVEFRHAGLNTSTNALDGALLDDYYSDPDTPSKPNNAHSQMFNGDEISVVVKFKTYATGLDNSILGGTSGGWSADQDYKRGYNFIKPFIQLCNGSTELDSTYFCTGDHQVDNATYNPYLYQQASYSGDVFSNVSGYNHLTGDNNAWHYLKPFQSDGYVVFPVTQNPTGNTLVYYGSAWNNEFDQDYATHTIGARFKFTDGNTGSGTAEAKVVDDLWIRVGNANTTIGALNTSSTASPNTYPEGFQYPRFEIESVHVTKLFGITGPSTAADAGDTGTYVTYYGDESDGVADEGWTYSDLGNTVAGEWNADGEFVLNQAAINAYNANNAYSQPNIPEFEVEAFVEVEHLGYKDGLSFPYSYPAGIVSTTDNSIGEWVVAKTQNWFGNNRTAIKREINKTDQTTGAATGATVTYWEKGLDPVTVNSSNAYQSPQEDVGSGIPFNKTLGGTTYSTTAGSRGAQFNDTGSSPSVTTFNDVVNDYWRIQTDSGLSGHQRVSWDISGSDYELNHWYLVDIELDESLHPGEDFFDDTTPPTIGSGGNDGRVVIGVVGDTNGVDGAEVDINGVGTFYQTGSWVSISTQWKWRHEYGNTPKWVLRAIYQVHPNSWTNSGHMDEFTLRFYNFANNPVYVSKVITRDITWNNGLGAADDWMRDGDAGNTGFWAQYHTLTDTDMYVFDDKLCWDSVTSNSEWSQDFGGNTPALSGNGWTLGFSLGTNAKTTGFTGELGVGVSNVIGDFTAGEYNGMHVTNIHDQGNYEIKFTMDDDTTNWTIEKGGSDYSGSVDHFGLFNTGVFTVTDVAEENRIVFYESSGGTIPLSMGISNITLTNQTTILEGGTVGSWNFDGFETTIDDYIIWDGTSGDGRIQFTDCPTFDPNATSTVIEAITANQLVDKPINRYEKYEISFDYCMESKMGVDGQGLLHMYYFNNEGYGFRIQDIGDPLNGSIANPSYGIYSPGNIEEIGSGPNPVRKVTMVVEIGDDEASSELTDQGVEALLNTFVIRRDDSDDTHDVTCWVDNISMKRVYNIEYNNDGTLVYPETTVTFSEDVNGWTSFKSFVPENGLSLSKKYFTLKDARLFQHYIPLEEDKDPTSLTFGEIVVDSTLENAENYNTFYGTPYSSTIKAVLNAEPSIIKTFNTLNYEGSQAHITNPMANIDLTNETNLDDNPIITIHNAKAWSLSDPTSNFYPNIDGWKVTRIETDMDAGSLKDFVKKEGKWFGYIKGKRVAAGTLDTSRFSVQGIGFASRTIDVI